MTSSGPHTVVQQWAHDTQSTTDDVGLNAILSHVRRRGDAPNKFPNATQMKKFLVKTGCTNLVSILAAWESYYGYYCRAARPSQHAEEVATSRAEARRLKRPTYHGLPCDQGHGTLKHTGNGQCVECKRLYRIKWKREYRNGIELEPLTPEEQAIYAAALTKTSRRA